MKKRRVRYTESYSTDICKCNSRKGATGFYYVEHDKNGKVAWGCSECFLAIDTGTFLWYLTRCDSCLDEFSSPWEDICKKCHSIEYSDMSIVDGRIVRTPLPDAPVYKGWAWGASQEATARDRRAEEAHKHDSAQLEKESEDSLGTA